MVAITSYAGTVKDQLVDVKSYSGTAVFDMVIVEIYMSASTSHEEAKTSFI